MSANRTRAKITGDVLMRWRLIDATAETGLREEGVK